MSPNLHSPLACKVLRHFIGGSLLMFSVIIFLLGSFELAQHRRLAQESTEQYLQTTVDVMSIALWNYDLQQIRALAESFLVLDAVSSVAIVDSSGASLVFASRQGEESAAPNQSGDSELVMMYTHSPSGTQVGSIRILMQLPDTQDFLEWRFFVLAIMALGLVAIFAAFIFTFLKREIITPVVKVSRFVRSISPDIDQVLKLELESPSGLAREINDLAQSVNDLVEHIVVAHKARQHAEQEASTMTEEVERIGRITAAQSISTLIAHEINQPLGAALFNAESALSMLKRQPGADPALTSVLQDIVSQTHRASEVVQSIRNIVQNSRTPPEPVSARALISETVQLLAYDSRFRNIPVEFTNITDTIDFSVLGDSKQLQRIIINILANAADAIKGAGIDNGWITIGIAQRNQSSFNISISDNGPGLTPDFLNLNFKPYLTSKPDGMGVGLWIAQLLTERHGGSIEFANNSAGGALFRISLPICDSASDYNQANV